MYAQDRWIPFERPLRDTRAFAYRLTKLHDIRGADCIVQNHPSSRPILFEFKARTYGTEASDVAALWHNIEKPQIRRTTLGGASVLASAPKNALSCVILVERLDTLYIAEVDTALSITRLCPLPLSQSTSTASLSVPSHAALLSTLHSDTYTTNLGIANTARLIRLADGEAFALVIGMYLFWIDWRISSPDSTRIRFYEGYTLSDAVALNPYTHANTDPALAILRESGLRKDVIFLSPYGNQLWFHSLDIQQRTILRRVSNYSVAACTEQGSIAYVTILRMGEQPMSTGIAAPIECIACTEESAQFSVFAITYDYITERLLWTAVRIPLQARKKPYSEILWTFPERLLAPLAVIAHDEELCCLFGNALVLMNTQGEVLALLNTTAGLRYTFGAIPTPDVRIYSSTDKSLYSVQIGRDCMILRRDPVPLWWLKNIIQDVWIYAVVLIVGTVLAILLAIVRYQRRLLATLFDAPNADAMLIVDNEGKLLSLNEAARSLLGIAFEAPMKRLFQFYCVDDAARKLSEFVYATSKSRSSAQTTITFRRPVPSTQGDTEPHDYLFSAVPLQTRFGVSRGMMFIGKDITEELGKKKLGSWSQLGHDLQTNLAAIRLNAEKLSEAGLPEGKSIVYQTRLVQQRIKDIITIGKSEQFEMKPANAAEICQNVCREFDASLYPNVEFHIEAQHIIFLCAQPQLERALRNAVENGIKRGLPNHTGTITITAMLHTHTGKVVFTVRDNGKGMNKAILQKMMHKGFTTFESSGGFGLGTMIMQYIIKAHDGEIVVESEEGKGTSVQFFLPARGARLLTQKPLRIVQHQQQLLP
ncbi:MAG: ATP-binding protein [Bacteroidota bacterium]|nr:ATP-binding protein [Candidatus Kapabacteria bacterium]MDW8220385.1 ATP-binding protein [Bacteroidota bacterium]